MTSSRALISIARRSTTLSRSYQTTALRMGGASPPLPPFARAPVPSQKLVENNDAVWDDGVAPELALDYDCQHVSSTEGILSWLGGLSLFAGLYQLVKISDPPSKNPAVNRKMNMVIESPRVGRPE